MNKFTVDNNNNNHMYFECRFPDKLFPIRLMLMPHSGEQFVCREFGFRNLMPLHSFNKSYAHRESVASDASEMK